jgi:hypothetical protein
MGTDARHACPVCSEPYAERPDRCFRCETPLGAWWPFEDVARGVASPRVATTVATRKRPAWTPVVIVALLGAGAWLGSVWTSARARVAPAASVSPSTVRAVPSAPPTPRTVIFDPETGTVTTAPAGPSARAAGIRPTYRVQRGDSLWRIAAAFTGDGRNWTVLWPARDPAQPLVVGTVLDVPLLPLTNAGQPVRR